MEPRIELNFSELYALERAARSARAREIARLIQAGVKALGAWGAVSRPNRGKDVCHA